MQDGLSPFLNNFKRLIYHRGSMPVEISDGKFSLIQFFKVLDSPPMDTIKENTLAELFKVPQDQRDLKWETDFFMSFTQSRVGLISEGPIEGPDSWPYLLVTTEKDATEPVQKVLHWLSDKGVGLVVNPEQEYP